MSPIQQRAVRVAVRVAGRLARRHVERSRSLRWAVRVPLVTLAVVSVCCLMLLTVPRGRLR